MRRLTESFAFEGENQQVQGMFDTAQKRLQSSLRWRIIFMRSTLSCHMKITINDFYYFILYHIPYVNFMQNCMIYIYYYMAIFILHPKSHPILVRGHCISARQQITYKIYRNNKKTFMWWMMIVKNIGCNIKIGML